VNVRGAKDLLRQATFGITNDSRAACQIVVALYDGLFFQEPALDCFNAASASSIH